MDEAGQPRKLVTLEREDRFRTCFAAFVESFTQHMEALKAAKPKSEICVFVFQTQKEWMQCYLEYCLCKLVWCYVDLFMHK